MLDTLTEREQKVLRLRFGMNDGRARTLEEVGREFDVTRERIRPDRGEKHSVSSVTQAEAEN